MRRPRILASAVIGAVLLLSSVPTAASATQFADDVDPVIADMLEDFPGGLLLSPNHAVWPASGMEMTAPGETASRSVGTCATGRICAYDGANRNGRMLSWPTCGTITPTSTFTIASAANARASGYAQVRNGSTVVTTVFAGNWANVNASSTNIRCFL
ncbi:MAG: hypothetical protein P0Y60_11870 [Candidatus Microbacterium colombiense]|nr:MAG: hypothetical protein P0Y60_11870 [Microbacterium sp.]